jgi:hypothetical protein
VKLDILVAFIIVFTYNLPSLGGAAPEEGPDILDLINVGSSDSVRKFYSGVLTTDGIVRIIPVKGVERSYFSNRMLTIIISEFYYI